MRTLNDLLGLIRTQVLVYMDDHYFCDCKHRDQRLGTMVVTQCVRMNVYHANPGENWMDSGPVQPASFKHEY